ncbi:hypothetical protein QJS04_geneDACA013114 [Acorus gramineus]|uniref:Uncharacterized protein n=1 Tax=Acorus gramineus TaxID=55184 RepID=A0AAV9B4U2_ACOGR|nr:hypothetical protein QJS04_geneDACA013114 [Acorus gramineus]
MHAVLNIHLQYLRNRHQSDLSPLQPITSPRDVLHIIHRSEQRRHATHELRSRVRQWVAQGHDLHQISKVVQSVEGDPLQTLKQQLHHPIREHRFADALRTVPLEVNAAPPQ